MKGRVLVYGMGVIGSVYALRLAKAGYAVTGLARGERLATLRSGGLSIRNVLMDEEESAVIEIVDSIPKDTGFDIVLVTLRSGQVMDALGRLQACPPARAVVVIGNNLEDHAAEAVTAGEERLVPSSTLRASPGSRTPRICGEFEVFFTTGPIYVVPPN